MVNLLPRDLQHDVATAYRARLLIACSCALLCAAVVALLALLPSYIALHIEHPTVPKTESSSSLSSAQTASDHSVIAGAQFLAAQLKPFASATTTAPSDAIIEALSLSPQGVHIQHINYMPGIPGVITISGSADNGGDVDEYKTALLRDTKFQSVSVPVSSLISVQNGSFNITLSGAF